MAESSLAEPLPIVLVPGLLATARLYAEQIPELWRIGPVMIAVHTRDDSMSGIAQRILACAPPRFALAGLSMGGYIAFEILRQAPARVVRLALLDTSARPDAPEQTEQRRAQIELARRGRLAEVSEVLFPRLVHTSRRDDEILRRTVRVMAEEVGPEAFINQQTAIMRRPDSRPGLASIRAPTLVLVGDGDQLTPPERAAEIASGIPGAQLVTVAGSGHLSTLEQPGAVTQALTSFLTH
ncbi:MAG TPA: alpha/beta fold hydrolase [Steroidobacteraceae bacterium]|nr:alpha/beta fold hydrolase [Steroidobacteraceae bacterium]